jgi:hypothetical protein
MLDFKINCDNFGYLHLMIRQIILAYRIFKLIYDLLFYICIEKFSLCLLKYSNNFDIPEFAWKFCTLELFGESSSVDSQNCRNWSWSLTCITCFNDWIQFTKGVFDNCSYTDEWETQTFISDIRLKQVMHVRLQDHNSDFDINIHRVTSYSPYIIKLDNFSFKRILQNLRWTLSMLSLFQKPDISLPYKRIGLIILSKRSNC